MLSRHTSARRGFTIIETLTAMAVLATGLVAGAHLFSYSIEAAARAERISRAAFLVTRKAEELRLTPPGALAPGGTLDPSMPAPGYHQYLAFDRDGRPKMAPAKDAAVICLWRVDAGAPERVHVAVFGMSGRPGRHGTLLAHLSSAFR